MQPVGQLHPFFFKHQCPERFENKTENTQKRQEISLAQQYRLKEIILHASPEEMLKIQTAIADIYFERSSISLRTSEWGIFNYAKYHQSIVVQHKQTAKVNIVNVYETYLRWRRNYKRKLFDQYRREAEIFFVDPVGGKPVPTTPAQINFFWFLVSEQLLAFLLENSENIKEHSKEIRKQKKVLEDAAKLAKGNNGTKKKFKGIKDKRELLIKQNKLEPHFVVDVSVHVEF